MNANTYQEPHNVDCEEITKFEALASRWWDPEGEFKPLHRINPLRLSYIAEHSCGLFGKKVLDVGCGGGLLSEGMAREGARVTGIDIGYKPLQIAHLHAMKYGVQVNYLQKTVEEYATKHQQCYDVVTCMEMLEHVPNPQSVINACAKLVKPGGQVFFSTINRNIKSWLMTVIVAEYILRIIPKGTHNVKKFIKPAELLAWVDQTCLEEQHIVGLHYNPMLDKFKLCQSIDTNYMLHTKAKISTISYSSYH